MKSRWLSVSGRVSGLVKVTETHAQGIHLRVDVALSRRLVLELCAPVIPGKAIHDLLSA